MITLALSVVCALCVLLGLRSFANGLCALFHRDPKKAMAADVVANHAVSEQESDATTDEEADHALDMASRTDQP